MQPLKFGTPKFDIHTVSHTRKHGRTHPSHMHARTHTHANSHKHMSFVCTEMSELRQSSLTQPIHNDVDREHATSLFDNELANSRKEFQRVLPNNFGHSFNVEFLDSGDVFTRQTDVARLVTNLTDETQDNSILYKTTWQQVNPLLYRFSFEILVLNSHVINEHRNSG